MSTADEKDASAIVTRFLELGVLSFFHHSGRLLSFLYFIIIIGQFSTALNPHLRRVSSQDCVVLYFDKLYHALDTVR